MSTRIPIPAGELEAIRRDRPVTTVGQDYWERWRVADLLDEVERLRGVVSDQASALIRMREQRRATVIELQDEVTRLRAALRAIEGDRPATGPELAARHGFKPHGGGIP